MQSTRNVDGLWIVRAATVALIACASLLSGCAGGRAGRGDAFRPEPVAGDQGAVYVYRERGPGGPVRVFIDQTYVGDLNSGEYLVRVVTPGEQIVRVERGSSMARSTILIAGQAAYFEVRTRGLGKHPELNVPDEESARMRIASSARVP